MEFDMAYSERGKAFTPHTTFRARPVDRALLEALSERLGITRTAVLQQALRCLAAREGVPVPPADRPPKGRLGDY